MAFRNGLIIFKRMILDLYHFIRSQYQITKIFGPQYIRNLNKIEIDITYRCNLKCTNCNRSCSQAPTSEEMTIGHLEKFIKESVNNNIKWKQIRILGGEPTLHTKFFAILQLLLMYKHTYNPGVRIVIVTNGFGNLVKRILKKLPKEIEVENSNKDSGNQSFFPFNMAPKDNILYKNVDFSNGCWILSDCGIGLNSQGYYLCAVAGGIDRIFNFNVGRKKLPLSEDSMIDHAHIFCRLCGHFRFSFPTKKEKISPSWKIAYMLYNERMNGRFRI